MKTKTKSRIAALVLTILAVIYVALALTHPEMSLPVPFGTKVTGVLYGLYVGVVVVLFIAPFEDKK